MLKDEKHRFAVQTVVRWYETILKLIIDEEPSIIHSVILPQATRSIN